MNTSTASNGSVFQTVASSNNQTPIQTVNGQTPSQMVNSQTPNDEQKTTRNDSGSAEKRDKKITFASSLPTTKEVDKEDDSRLDLGEYVIGVDKTLAMAAELDTTDGTKYREYVTGIDKELDQQEDVLPSESVPGASKDGERDSGRKYNKYVTGVDKELDKDEVDWWDESAPGAVDKEEVSAGGRLYTKYVTGADKDEALVHLVNASDYDMAIGWIPDQGKNGHWDSKFLMKSPENSPNMCTIL